MLVFLFYFSVILSYVIRMLCYPLTFPELLTFCCLNVRTATRIFKINKNILANLRLQKIPSRYIYIFYRKYEDKLYFMGHRK